MAALTATLGASCAEGDALTGEGDPKGELAPHQPVRLVIETPTDLQLLFGEQTTIVARVFWDDGRPAPSRAVRYQLSGNYGTTSLLMPQVTTGNDGRAENTMAAGDIRTSFQVFVSTKQHDNTDLVETINVSVDGTYFGGLRVRYDYNDVIPVTDIRTNLHEGALNCAAVQFDVLPPMVGSDVAATPTNIVTFADLEEDKVYSVTAIGQGPMGNDVTYGCAVADPIAGRGSVDVTVPLALEPANMTGTYDFGTRLHLDEALPGDPMDITSPQGIITTLEDFFFDPTGTLADFMVDGIVSTGVLGSDAQQVRNALGLLWQTYVTILVPTDRNGDMVVNLLDADMDQDGDLIDDALDFLIFDSLPAWVDNALTIGGDVTSLVTDLTVGGKLDITTASANGDLAGHWEWSQFVFMWRAGQMCDLDDACCGRTTFSGTEMGMAPIGADFDGQALARAAADRTEARPEYDLTIPAHRLDVQYGQIIIFALEQFVLPALTGEADIACAVESLFGCDGMGEFSCGAPSSSTNMDACGCARAGNWLGDLIGADPAIGNTACGFAVTAATDYVEGLISDLAWSGTDDGYFTMSIDGMMADDDLDLQTDLIDGTTTGTLHISQDVGSFGGTILGDIERTACVADTACDGGQTCQVKLDVLDQCTGRMVCVHPVGDRVAGDSCTIDTQCASGRCINGANTCLTACGDDLDCPGTLSCGMANDVRVDENVTMDIAACGM